ncbi:acetylornithine deacetylase [Mameliella alba]|uniref:acetylornithine deacetylase n=1 Tax=Mameliella alba TaxID=561184 RepID=UPI00089247C7|nr:acetylornithine deacetylase [Mameliella alba]OWV48673.1 acetylornithine deacetylase [Mameliella alba]PTR39230.1 acetylornithine deacetylase [Mameliella alba]GGF64240.1 acetylornithine deacetylase [Mameliella alba]SDD27343.1 acetylornithine deacetylase [Mameliella alba]
MTQTLEILDRLISFDTVSTRSNLDLIAYVEDFLKSRGFAVTRVADTSEPKAGLYASIGPEGAGVMLSAHTDVVPVEGQEWTRDPFRLTSEGDRLFGRGTTDMKGFLASMLAAADRASQAPLREPLKLAISYDEEVGCVGIARMIDALEPAIGLPRACIVGEPTEMQVAVGHKGKQGLRAICHGEAGHSALAPRFTNALHLAADLVTGLRGLQDDLARHGARDADYAVPYSTVHAGVLKGGTVLNIVPDRAELLFEFRHLAADAPADLVARIRALASQITERHGTAIDLQEVTGYPGLDTAPDAEVTRLTQRLARTQDLTKVAFGTEAGFFDALGIPTVVCGPGSMEGQGHKPDEYLERGQLTACDSMMDALLDELR